MFKVSSSKRVAPIAGGGRVENKRHSRLGVRKWWIASVVQASNTVNVRRVVYEIRIGVCITKSAATVWIEIVVPSMLR